MVNDTPRFYSTDFNPRFGAFDRTEYLPRLAAIAFGLTAISTPADKAKQAAIKTAEDSLGFMRACLRKHGG